jgi:hypothetical protein
MKQVRCTTTVQEAHRFTFTVLPLVLNDFVLNGGKKPRNLPVCVLLTKTVWLEQSAVPLEVHTNTAAIHAIIVLFRLKVGVNRQFL